jgi:hypothetical protein
VRKPLVLLAIVLGGSVAHADDVDDLVAKGQDLAQRSEYTQAIASFKAADAKRPRAAHACMIGLAYMRREAWPQAELFLALCEKRAVPGDQPPDWIDEAHKQLAQKLSAAQIPAVTINVVPAGIGARLTVSSFAPDEVFDPQTIHLAPGKHTVEVTAPGHRTVQQQIIVQPAVPQTLTFQLAPTDTLAEEPFTPKPRTASKVPWIVGGIGVGIGAIAGIYHATSVRSAYQRADGAQTPAAYDVLATEFNDKRNVAVGLYAASAITIGVAVVLRYTVYKDAPAVTAQIGNGGGGILVGWQR